MKQNKSTTQGNPVSRRGFLGGVFGLGLFSFASQDANAATYLATAQLQALPEPGKALIAVKANQASKVYIEYGYSSSSLNQKTSTITLKAGAPREHRT